jgi:hypothetical protein
MAIKHVAFKGTHKEIDLTGMDGNAFHLLSLADSTAHQLDYNKDERKALEEEMKAGDYAHLVKTFDKHFGWYFTFYTDDLDILGDDK